MLMDDDCRRLILFQYRKYLRRMKFTDNELIDTFKRLTSMGNLSLSSELFQNELTRQLDVVLTTGVSYQNSQVFFVVY